MNNASQNATFHNIIAQQRTARPIPVDIGDFCGLLTVTFCATRAAASKRQHVSNGLDILEMQSFAPLRGKHIGLVSNHPSDWRGRSNIELLTHVRGIHLTALFSPKHGLAGRVG